MPYENYTGSEQIGNSNPQVKAAADRRDAAENDVPMSHVKPAQTAGPKFGKYSHVSID